MAACMHDYPEQLHAYLELVRAFDNREAAIFFVDGPGGSNKSFLFEAFLHYARGRDEIAAACAWSGLAATLLPGGRTCHARFGFLVPLPREDVPWSVTATTGFAFQPPLTSETLQSSALINWPGLPPNAQ